MSGSASRELTFASIVPCLVSDILLTVQGAMSEHSGCRSGMRWWVCLVVGCLVGVVRACPWACACRPSAADCAHRALTHVPRPLPPDTLRL
ncbi:unnamed protein product [Pieris macdunnoughi]|uniref:Uncharacterized protein n=1 Tax=Pieris macdunnoughi TaxID=345717 RepID=A0A821X5M9_9NEOP|nr:unnamed protein product [Pieris macdunnoughi]